MLFHEYGGSDHYSNREESFNSETGDIGGANSQRMMMEGTFQPALIIADKILFRDKALRKENEIRKVFTVIINVALNLLPFMALDEYP
jgi:hypothetical protein